MMVKSPRRSLFPKILETTRPLHENKGKAKSSRHIPKLHEFTLRLIKDKAPKPGKELTEEQFIKNFTHQELEVLSRRGNKLTEQEQEQSLYESQRDISSLQRLGMVLPRSTKNDISKYRKEQIRHNPASENFVEIIEQKNPNEKGNNVNFLDIIEESGENYIVSLQESTQTNRDLNNLSNLEAILIPVLKYLERLDEKLGEKFQNRLECCADYKNMYEVRSA